MQSYRHIRHAGNFADVTKHAVLAMLVEALQRHSGTISVIDTHAGVGRYDLGSREAMHKGEWQSGIGRVYHAPEPHPALHGYLRAVAELNEHGKLRIYPGSPRIIRSLLRPQDHLLAFELDPHEHALLAENFEDDKQVEARQQDGYGALETWLPPVQQNGLVLFDPTFERRDEYRRLVAALREAYGRWPTGTFAAWYPTTAGDEQYELRDAIGTLNMNRVMTAELTIAASTDPGVLTGCGMVLVNYPADLDVHLHDVLHWLWTHLAVDSDTGVSLRLISVQPPPL